MMRLFLRHGSTRKKWRLTSVFTRNALELRHHFCLVLVQFSPVRYKDIIITMIVLNHLLYGRRRRFSQFCTVPFNFQYLRLNLYDRRDEFNSHDLRSDELNILWVRSVTGDVGVRRASRPPMVSNMQILDHLPRFVWQI